MGSYVSTANFFQFPFRSVLHKGDFALTASDKTKMNPLANSGVNHIQTARTPYTIALLRNLVAVGSYVCSIPSFPTDFKRQFLRADRLFGQPFLKIILPIEEFSTHHRIRWAENPEDFRWHHRRF